MRSYLPPITLLVTLGLASAGIQAQTGYYAYIPNSLEDTVSVIDTDTNTVIDTITVGFGPQGIEVHPDGTRVYVANNGNDGDGNTVSVIDAATRTVVNTISLPAEGGPEGMGFHPNGKLLYVTLAGPHNLPPDCEPDSLAVIDTDTDTVLDVLAVNDHPWDAAVTPDGSKLFVANGHFETLTVVDPDTFTITDIIELGDGCDTGRDHHTAIVEMHPDGNELWVAHMHSDTVSVVDTASNVVEQQFSTRDAQCQGASGVCEHSMGIKFKGDGTLAFITLLSKQEVLVMDALNKTEITRVRVGDHPKGLGVHPDDDRVYIGNQFDNNVVVLDIATLSVTDTIPVGDSPIPFGNFFVPKEVPTVPLGGTALGTNVQRVICQNTFTGQRVNLTRPAANSWDCEAAGLSVNSGDLVNLTITGTATSSTEVGAALTGTNIDASTRVTCSVGRGGGSSVSFSVLGTDTWNCVDQGLVVSAGTAVTQVIRAVKN